MAQTFEAPTRITFDDMQEVGARITGWTLGPKFDILRLFEDGSGFAKSHLTGVWVRFQPRTGRVRADGWGIRMVVTAAIDTGDAAGTLEFETGDSWGEDANVAVINGKALRNGNV